MKVKLHLGYTVVALGYMTGIFILSELPAQCGGGPLDPVREVLSNLLHIPLFAGLAWCLLMCLSDGQWYRTVSCQLYGIIGLLAGAYAAVDEWHQSFVTGRSGSVGDFLLDCLGIGGLLLIHQLVRGREATSRTSSTSSVPGPTPSRWFR